jgi:hypothetical protein
MHGGWFIFVNNKAIYYKKDIWLNSNKS